MTIHGAFNVNVVPAGDGMSDGMKHSPAHTGPGTPRGDNDLPVSSGAGPQHGDMGGGGYNLPYQDSMGHGHTPGVCMQYAAY
jgi:hypothetical protein